MTEILYRENIDRTGVVAHHEGVIDVFLVPFSSGEAIKFLLTVSAAVALAHKLLEAVKEADDKDSSQT